MGIDPKDLADLLDGKTIEVSPEDAAKIERAIKAHERAKMAERVHDIMSSSILTPAESLKSGADSLVDGIMLANADPNDPNSAKKRRKDGCMRIWNTYNYRCSSAGGICGCF